MTVSELIKKASNAKDANEALTWAKAAHHAAMAIEAKSKATYALNDLRNLVKKSLPEGLDVEA